MHRAALQSADIADLSGLGSLRLGGALVPSVGVMRPSPDIPFGRGGPLLLEGKLTLFSNARVVNSTGDGLIDIGGRAVELSATPHPSPVFPVPLVAPLAAGAIFNFDTAYWAASVIELLDDTLVVIKDPIKIWCSSRNRSSSGTGSRLPGNGPSWECRGRPALRLPKLNPPNPRPSPGWTATLATPAGLAAAGGMAAKRPASRSGRFR
jgi:hypothetical protein